MQLNDQQIRAFAAGVDHVQSVDGGWRLHRMPESMLALYAASEGLLTRALCMSSVRLRFVSDTRWIKLTVRYREQARWYFTCAMVIDNGRIDAFGPVDDQKHWRGVVFIQDNRERHSFDLWLPHLCAMDIVSIEVEDGCVVEPAPPLKLRWLAWGDSITQGMNASQPVMTWASRAARLAQAEIINFGVGGATMQEQLPLAMPDLSADLITVSYGANDWNSDVPLDRFRQNTIAMIEALRRRHPGVPLVLTTPIPFFRAIRPNKCGASLDDFRRAIEEVAQNRPQVHVVSGTDLLPEDHAYYYDWSHPNDNGMHLYAQNLLEKLRQMHVI